MNELGFSCSYTKVRDVEGTSPCGRRATRRAMGDPKCMGHWVVEHLITGVGGTDHARKTWAFVYYFVTFLGLATIANMFGHWWRADSTPPLYFIGVATLLAGGVFIGYYWEHQLGGMTWLITMPFAAVVFMIYGTTLLRRNLGQPPPDSAPTSRMTDTLIASADVLIALGCALMWAHFLLYYTRRYRWMNLMRLLGTALYVLVIVAAVVMAVISGGSSSSLLTWFILLAGAMVVASGTARLKNLARHIRV